MVAVKAAPPAEELFKLFPKLKLQFSQNSGPADWMWGQYKLKVPAGTQVDFVETDKPKKNYILRLARLPDLLVDFRIEPMFRNQGQGTFPKNFVPVMPTEIREAYSYVFTVYLELQWRGDRSTGQDYIEWVNGLEAGLRKKLVIP